MCVRQPLLHLFGSWRRHAIKNRGFSFSNLESDKIGAKLIILLNTQQTSKNILFNNNPLFYRILKVNGQVSSFHFGFPLEFSDHPNVFAHAIGISDVTIPHLSEFSQIDFWKYIQSQGFQFVNDGPSWKKSLALYKMKYRPFQINNYYWIWIAFKYVLIILV